MASKNTKIITVTDNQVHQSKNPNVYIISVSDMTSANNFSSFPVFASEVADAKKSGKDITVDLDRTYDISKAVSKSDDTSKYTYEHSSVTGSDIIDMYQKGKEAAIAGKDEKVNKDEPKKAESNVFMNRVSEKLIHQTKKSGLMRVSIPDETSVNGMANILVPASNIFQSTKRGKEPIVGMKNINLGSENSMIKYSVVGADGKFVQSEKTASEVADRWQESQSKFLQKSATQAAEQAAEIEKGSEDQPYYDDDEPLM